MTSQNILYNKYLRVLEYDKILHIISGYAFSSSAKTKILEIQPVNILEHARFLQDETEEAFLLYQKYNLRPLSSFDDIGEIVVKTKAGAVLAPFELRKILSVLKASRHAKTTITNCNASAQILRSNVENISLHLDLEKQIDISIFSDSEVSDAASEKLRSLRRRIKSAENNLREKLQGYTKSSSQSKYLQDDLVTIRNGRYVIPVKSEYKSSVPGLVHDRSDTGATFFIEPIAVVEMNNEIKALKLDEEEEVFRILKELSENVSAIHAQLVENFDVLIYLDVLFAKVGFAINYDCNRPLLNQKGIVKLINSRHPLISKSKVVPVNIEFGEKHKILAITGPNTGGKTVSLKTIGLLSLLAASGLMIPADANSEISIFDGVFADIGDEQSIVSSLSTFSSHILNIIEILKLANASSLILLDEVGGGTDPKEGAALALGIIKHIENLGCTCAITTHYGEIKEYGLRTDRILNASMQFDSETFMPTYRLLSGLPGSSNALKIAQSLGMNSFIIQSAIEALPKEILDYEKVLREAENIKKNAEQQRKDQELELEKARQLRLELENKEKKLSEKLDKLTFNSKIEIKKLVAHASEEAAELIAKLKEKVEIADEKSLLEARIIRNKIEKIDGKTDDFSEEMGFKPLDESKLAVGMNVYINSLKTSGVIKKINKGKREAFLQAGAAMAMISFDNLSLIEENRKEKKNSVDRVATVSKSISNEINVIGKTGLEAIFLVDPVLSLAYDEGCKEYRIIHGKGTGALARAIQQHLKGLPYVKSFRFGRHGEGDTGVTIVEFK